MACENHVSISAEPSSVFRYSSMAMDELKLNKVLFEGTSCICEENDGKYGFHQDYMTPNFPSGISQSLVDEYGAKVMYYNDKLRIAGAYTQTGNYHFAIGDEVFLYNGLSGDEVRSLSKEEAAKKMKCWFRVENEFRIKTRVSEANAVEEEDDEEECRTKLKEIEEYMKKEGLLPPSASN